MTDRIAGFLITFALATFAPGAQAASEIQITFQPWYVNAQIPATLIRPDGDGPFPAVVILHDCTGLGPRSSGGPRLWAQELVAQGFVVLLPDSFTPRDLPDGICTVPREVMARAHYITRTGDALAALGALRALPYVDKTRIGVMGGSHGGAVTLATMVEAADGRFTQLKQNNFAAGIAFYARCDENHGNWKITGRRNGDFGPPTGYTGVYRPLAPVLILSGEKDDWTPAEPCRQMTEVARAAGHPVEIKIYPGAHHGFDSNYQVRYSADRNNPYSPTGKGATSGGNQAAWEDSKKQVAEFFARHLKGAR